MTWSKACDLTAVIHADADSVVQLTAEKIHENGTEVQVWRHQSCYDVVFERNGGFYTLQTQLVPGLQRGAPDRIQWLYDELLHQTGQAPPWITAAVAPKGCAHAAEVIACDTFFRL